MLFSANSTWFEFSASGEPGFSVYSFDGEEEINAPFEFTVELVHLSSQVNITALVGAPASLSIGDRSGGKRYVHGIIREISQLHTSNVRTHYSCKLVPRLWFLGQRVNHRIYQEQSVPEIITALLQEQGFSADAFSMRLAGTYKPREYCVQYGETDLYMLNRLCEEEGIYYFFEHDAKGSTLCFADFPGGPAIPGQNELRFFEGSGQMADTAVIDRLSVHRSARSNASMYKEWNFQHPSLNLGAARNESRREDAPVPAGTVQEVYRYPHIYQLQTPGLQYAELQLLRQLTFSKWIEGEADVSRLTPGHLFALSGHGRADVNAKWMLFRVEHYGEQPQVLEHEAPDRGMQYRSKFKAIPETTRFVPEVAHPKNRVVGEQTAIVTGPGGEEIFPDKYGRVKVQFHWDREGGHTERSSCWIRVSQTWAGEQFGGMTIPRVGHEVIVSFLEGDPDRPIITGRVYHALNMPPYELPAQKTLSGIQSREVQANRRNQLIMDDTTGQIQAQLSSDHQLSQLNLGYITRLDHVKGRNDFRGEGFELRTDGWGVVRAGSGLVLTTDARQNAKQHQKDLEELNKNLTHAVDQHVKQSNLAVEHKGQEAGNDKQPLQEELEKQLSAVTGSGKAHGELTHPQLALSSPAGIASSTPGSTHLHSGKNTNATSGKHFSIAAGHSLLVSAMQKVSLFAHKAGMKLFAGRGKVEIQAQSDALDLIAEKELRVFSTKDQVKISSPKEIMLTAGSSYIKINASGVEIGTPGKVEIKSDKFNISGPASKPHIMAALPRADLDLEPLPNAMKITLASAIGAPVYANEPFVLYEDGVEIAKGLTDAEGNLAFPRNPDAKEYKVKLSNDNLITYKMVDKLPDGEEGDIQRALQKGFTMYENPGEGVDKLKGLKEHLMSVLGRDKV